MPFERELIGSARPDITGCGGPRPEDLVSEAGVAAEDADDDLLDLVIERDLAVQIVGSDAGKARRMRPHGAMTRGAAEDELAAVESVMRPFLAGEIRRVHEDKTHRPRHFTARATPAEARSLKAYCRRFATSLEATLDKHPGDDNRHRSRQRLDQSRRVIAQVDAALGLPPDDGRTLGRCRQEAAAHAERLIVALDALMARIDVERGEADATLTELLNVGRRFLASCQRP